MKHMRKILALALALMLVLGLATTAYAAEKNDSITVNNAVVGETYNLYKLFDLVVNDETDPTEYSYKVNSDWKDFFAAAAEGKEAGVGNKYITVNAAGYVTEIKDANGNATDDAKDLAKAAAEWANKPTATKTAEANGTSVVFDGLENGYWLITSTLGTKAMIETTPDKADVSVKEKNPEDTIAKEVKEDSSNTFGKNNDAQIGDLVEFKSVATLYPATRNVVIHDTMTEGLSFTAGSIKIFTDEALTTPLDTQYYVIQQTPATGDTFTIQIKDNYIATLNSETKLYLTYTATLNEKAVVTDDTGTDIAEQTNTAKITYGNKQSVAATTTTTTHKFSVLKYANGVENVHLADAVFSLKKAGAVVKLIKLDDNNYRVANAGETDTVDTFKTVADGDIVIWGVDADDDYTLLETEAPAGYNKLDTEKAVTVDANNATLVKVENKMGSTLPSTGGIGTTIFYVVGGLLVLAAIVLLVTKKRMASAK